MNPSLRRRAADATFARVALGRQPSQPALADEVVDDPADSLRGVSVALLLGSEAESELGLHRVVMQAHADVADQAVIRRQLDRVLKPAGLPRIPGGEYLRQLGRFRERHRWRPGLIARDARV